MHLRRVVGAPGVPRFFARRAEPFDLCATLKARLLYLRVALSSHQSSARKKSLSVPERARAQRALSARVMRRDAARNYADVYRTIIFTAGGSRLTHVVARGEGERERE